MTGIRRSKAGYFLIYTAAFAALAALISLVFHQRGYSLLFRPDGYVQHFAAYRSCAEYIRQLILSVLGRGSVPSLYSFSIGQGADALGVLGSYDFADPVTIVTSVIFHRNLMLGYYAMMWVKVYLAGICFSLFAFHFSEKKSAVFCGAMVYVFSGVSMVIIFRHPNFYSGMYCLPLMLLGGELYLENRRRVPLVLATALSALTNFYILYINVLLFIGYTVLRAGTMKPGGERTGEQADVSSGAGRKLFLMIRTGLVGTLGVALAGVVFLPEAAAFFGSGRSGAMTGYSKSFLHYPADYYQKFLKSTLTAAEDIGFWTVTGIAGIALVAALIMFLQKKKGRRYLLVAVIMIAAACVPLAGRILNGGGYPRNLWSYGAALFLAFCVVRAFPLFTELSAGVRAAALILLGAYAGLVWFLGMEKGMYAGFMMLILSGLAVLIASAPGRARKAAEKVVIFITVIGVAWSAFGILPPAGAEDKERFTLDSLKNAENEGRIFFPEETATEAFFRVEKSTLLQNQEQKNGYRGTTYFWSVMPEAWTQYCDDFLLNTLVQNCNWKGLDGRSALLSLASVRYYRLEGSGDASVPAGYIDVTDKMPGQDGSVRIFENPDALPVGYCYDGILDKAAYESADPVEKEHALLEGALLESTDSIPETLLRNIPVSGPQTDIRILKSEVSAGDGASFDGNRITVEKAGGEIKIRFTGMPDAEHYLYLKGLSTAEGGSVTNINVSADGIEKEGRLFTAENNWPVLREGITFQTGSHLERKEYEMTVRFEKKGVYAVDEIRICAAPLSSDREEIRKLKSCVMENAVVEDGKISGTVRCTGPKILQLSVPYGRGWTALVDGQKAGLIRSGRMYMALVLPEGNHEISLTYKTPFLQEGLIMTAAAAILLAVLAVISARQRAIAARTPEKFSQQTERNRS